MLISFGFAGAFSDYFRLIGLLSLMQPADHLNDFVSGIAI
jgi:hypothetical protein